MKGKLIFLMLLFAVIANAQKGELIMVKSDSKKERVIRENKRIQIVTREHKKVRGRFTIVDDQTLAIKGEPYQLDDIALIRRSPQFDAIMTIVNMVWIGGWSLIGGISGVIPIYFALPITAGTTYAIFDPPNFNKGYNRNKNWTYSFRTYK